jgi:S1-C subfamily serine protease
VLPELIATGKVLRPKLGWVLVDTTQGPMVRRVMPGSPAERSGIQPIERLVESVFVRGFTRDVSRADLILKVNGQSVASVDEVEDIVSRSEARREITLVLRRGGLDGPSRTVTVKPVLQ